MGVKGVVFDGEEFFLVEGVEEKAAVGGWGISGAGGRAGVADGDR